MNTISDQCLVLKVQPYKEKGALVTVFARKHGKITMILTNYKDPRKQWSAALQSFAVVDIELISPRSSGLWKARTINAVQKSQQQDPAAYIVLEMLHLLLQEGQVVPLLWSTLTESLAAFDKQKNVCIVLLKSLDALGYLPDLSHCTQTQKKFDQAGGQWQKNGEMVSLTADLKKYKLSFEQIKILSFWQKYSFDHCLKVIVDDDFVDKTLEHLVGIIENISGRSLKTRKMLMMHAER